MAEVVVRVVGAGPPGADMIDDLVSGWRSHAMRLRPELLDLVISAEFMVFVETDIGFWHFNFEVGENELEAISNGKLEDFAFCDEAGYFEDYVPRADVARKIVGMLDGT